MGTNFTQSQPDFITEVQLNKINQINCSTHIRVYIHFARKLLIGFLVPVLCSVNYECSITYNSLFETFTPLI